MYQNILRKEGFMLVDPHGMLTRSIMQILKEELSKDEYNEMVCISTLKNAGLHKPIAS